MGKGKLAQNEQFHLFPLCFLCHLHLKIQLATFQLLSAVSLNLGRCQNGVLEKELSNNISSPKHWHTVST